MYKAIIKFKPGKSAQIFTFAVMIFLLILSSGLTAEEAGFRPGADQENIDQFVNDFGSHTILCFPVIYRSSDYYRTIENSNEYLAEFFSGWDLYPAFIYNPEAPDFSETMSPTQWAVFETNLDIFSEYLNSLENNWDYAIAVEILMTNTPSGGQAVGGIQCYILDDQGEDVFSFLLNSHHDMFNDAELDIDSTDPEEIEDLALQSLFTILQALKIQIEEQ